MALSNTATPIYYGKFRDAVRRGEIPVCREVSMEMNRIDELIANPDYYYDDTALNDGEKNYLDGIISMNKKYGTQMLEAEEEAVIS